MYGLASNKVRMGLHFGLDWSIQSSRSACDTSTAGDGLRSFQTEGFTLAWSPELSKQWEKVFGAGPVGLQTTVKYTWCEK